MFRIILEFIIGYFSFKEKYHAILLQNNNELRATGGFITQVVLIRTKALKCTLSFKNVFSDFLTRKERDCPMQLQRMLFDNHTTCLQLRDANFDPDFKITAKNINEIFEDHGTPLATLSSLNVTFFEDILGIIGGIIVNKKQITKHNFFSFITAQVSDVDRHSLQDLQNRKLILKTVFKKICIRFFLKLYLFPEYIYVLQKALKKKDIQFYIFSSHFSSSSFTFKEGVDGLALIEDNYLGLKSNKYIRRNIYHDSFIEEKGNAIVNDLKILWNHHGYDNYPLSGKYRGYVRIYLPPNVTIHLVSQVNDMNVVREVNFTILEFPLYIAPKESFLFQCHYQVYVSNNLNYVFSFIKQSGVEEEFLFKSLNLGPSLQLNMTKNMKLLDMGYGFFSEKLTQDQVMEAEIGSSIQAPRVISHEIINKKEILIVFNEQVTFVNPIFQIKKKDKEEYLVIDGYHLESAGTVLHLQVNLPEEEEQFYTIILSGIVNGNGISLSPSPRSLTVVYRSKFFIKNA